MSTPFQISALPIEPFLSFFHLDAAALADLGATRCIADAQPGYPCRVSLEDAAVGEALILLPFIHHDVDSPYRASGPIYVRTNARQARPAVNEIPELVRRRLLSVRAYDDEGMMRDASVVEGRELAACIDTLFSDEQVAYIHLHNARPGCYSCRVDRAGAG